MSSAFRSMLLVAAAVLGGCFTVHIPTDPSTFSIEPTRLAHLRKPQAVVLANGVPADAPKKSFKLTSSSQNVCCFLGVPDWDTSATAVFDERRLTETAIAMLGRALDSQGIKTTQRADKRVTLKVNVLGAGMRFGAQIDASVGLDAAFGNGTSTYIKADNNSLRGGQRAYDGAVLFALNQLLSDAKFIAYMNE